MSTMTMEVTRKKVNITKKRLMSRKRISNS